jgi:hypothetical protein
MTVNCLKKQKTMYKALLLHLNAKWNQIVMKISVNKIKIVAITGKCGGENGIKENIRT